MTTRFLTVWIGYDPREAAAFAVAKQSIRYFHPIRPPSYGVVLSDLRAQGLYYRPTERRLGRLYDVISEHEMATEFAISRFLVPTLAKRRTRGKLDPGWALFMDCDVMLRGSLNKLLPLLDDSKAVYCVKHDHQPANTEKMDGQRQSAYARKNWSSVMAFNVTHPANTALDVEMVNTLLGRDLHRFCWLNDDQIGELPPEWNYLVGHTKTEAEPQIVHFTDGGPWLEAFRDVPYASEWNNYLEQWAA